MNVNSNVRKHIIHNVQSTNVLYPMTAMDNVDITELVHSLIHSTTTYLQDGDSKLTDELLKLHEVRGTETSYLRFERLSVRYCVRRKIVLSTHRIPSSSGGEAECTTPRIDANRDVV